MERWHENMKRRGLTVQRMGAWISTIVTTAAVVVLAMLLAPLIGAVLAVLVAVMLGAALGGLLIALIVGRRLLRQFRQVQQELHERLSGDRPRRRVDSTRIDEQEDPGP